MDRNERAVAAAATDTEEQHLETTAEQRTSDADDGATKEAG